jgi:ABC-type Na+ efflux pump permease subunit/membrane protease YdiL (CAAX protease family)
MRLADVTLVARKELRETLRDRRTLAIMILFPLVVYPLVSLATAQVMATRVNKVDTEVARVAVSGPPSAADGVRARLDRRHQARGDIAVSPSPATGDDVMAGHLDALVEVVPAVAPAAVPTARVLFDETRDRSRTARERVAEALAASDDAACAPAYAISAQGVAPRKAVGGYLLSKVMPLVIVVMVMLGAFHPAIDITAGERERGTLETTLSAPIARSALMAGKVVAVAALATISGMLNLASMSLTVLAGAQLAVSAPPLSLPWLHVAAAFAVVPPAAFLFASVMVAIGALARSFKEAQTLLTPVYFLCMAPSLLAALGDFELAGVAAVVPGVGVTLLARDLIVGHASWPAALAVLASTIAYGLAALVLAARLYDSERLLGGDEPGIGLRAWLRHLLFGSRNAEPDTPAALAAAPSTSGPTAGHALALYAIAVLLLFAFAPLQAWRLGPGLAAFQWIGLFGLTAVYARGSGRTLRDVLRLRRPSLASLAGAVLFGLSAWLVVGLLADWLLPAPKEVIEGLRKIVSPAESERGFLLTLLLVAVSPAVCEEALFRGPILRGLLTRLSPLGAALVTGLLFGLFHANLWKFIPSTVLGIGLSVIALASDSIVPAMVAHFVNNACLLLLVNRGLDASEAGTRPKVVLLVVGLAGITGAALLLARGRQTRRVSGA